MCMYHFFLHVSLAHSEIDDSQQCEHCHFYDYNRHSADEL